MALNISIFLHPYSIFIATFFLIEKREGEQKRNFCFVSYHISYLTAYNESKNKKEEFKLKENI